MGYPFPSRTRKLSPSEPFALGFALGEQDAARLKFKKRLKGRFFFSINAGRFAHNETKPQVPPIFEALLLCSPVNYPVSDRQRYARSKSSWVMPR